MTTLRTLVPGDFEALHEAFLDAFSDYIVQLRPTIEQLREMLTRRGWIPELSVGAFEDERLVGFVANALDDATAYDSGTGVVRSHRRRGLAFRVMSESIRILRQAGARQYRLEVIEANAPAAQLYRRLGFVERRGLQCWSLQPPPISSVPGHRPGTTSVEPELIAAWDVEPAWQNSIASIHRAGEAHVRLGEEDGYAIVFPSNGEVAQLSVDRRARRQGRGRGLLLQAAELAGKPLRIMNVDDADHGIEAFVLACGASKTIRQIEMTLTL